MKIFLTVMISGLFLAVKLENPEFQDSWSVSQRYWNIDWWQHDLDQIPRPWLPKSCYLPELHPCQIPNIDKCDYVALNKCSLVDLTSSNRCPLIHNLARLLIIINNSNALEEASLILLPFYITFSSKKASIMYIEKGEASKMKNLKLTYSGLKLSLTKKFALLKWPAHHVSCP